METAGTFYCNLVDNLLLDTSPEETVDPNFFTGTNFDIDDNYGRGDQHSDMRNSATSKNRLVPSGGYESEE